MREARAAARLRHPNIVEIHDVGQDGSDYYFVMAYLPGPSLKSLISRQGRLAPPDALRILRALADTLDYAHSKGLVHRDVKPANVMFDERGQAILMDLGIAKAAQETRLTATGITVGSPHYMAPEQIEGRPVDGRTDGYALGIMAFEMLTGRVPFDADTTTAILYKQDHEPPPSVTSCCPDFSGAVEIALDRMLAKSPADRFDSCSEFVNTLEQAVGLPAASAAAPKPLVAPALTEVYSTPTAPLPTEPPKVYAGPTTISPPPPPSALAAGRPLPWIVAGIAALLLLALIACAHVRAVFYQGNPAYGTGQDRECPMKTSTVRLTVVYLDGSRQDLTITITILQ